MFILALGTIAMAAPVAEGAQDESHLEPLVIFMFNFITLMFILDTIATTAPPAPAPPAGGAQDMLLLEPLVFYFILFYYTNG